ncbi:unnamed protein product [Brassica oleracea]
MVHTTTFHYLNQTSNRPPSASSPSTIMEVKRYQPTSPPSETIPIVDLSNPDEELVSRAVVKASQEEVIEEYTKETKKLSERLLGFLSEGLGLRHEALKEGLGGEKSEYVLRINNFPPNPRPDATLGLPEHTDIVALALIVTNEVPGLQVFHEGHWFDVQYVPSSITVTIGDQILRLSNGKYKNVLHRVTVDKEKQRMSWPVFVDANPDVVIRPLPELITGDNPSMFKSIICKDFKYRRLYKLPVD